MPLKDWGEDSRLTSPLQPPIHTPRNHLSHLKDGLVAGVEYSLAGKSQEFGIAKGLA